MNYLKRKMSPVDMAEEVLRAIKVAKGIEKETRGPARRWVERKLGLRGKRKFRRAIKPKPTASKQKVAFKRTPAMRVFEPKFPYSKPKRVVKLRDVLRTEHEQYGKLTKAHDAWFSFCTNPAAVMLDAAADVFLKHILSKIRLYYEHEDDRPIIGNQDEAHLLADSIQIRFRRDSNAEQPAGSTILKTIILTNHLGGGNAYEFKTFKELRDDMRLHIRTMATGDPGVAPNNDTVAYYPTSYTVYRRANDAVNAPIVDVPIYHEDDLSRLVLNLDVKQRVMFQNVTPNDDGTNALDVNGVNPLKGKMYTFKSLPRYREGLTNAQGQEGVIGIYDGTGNFDNLLDWADTDGIRTAGGTYEGIMSNIPYAREVFSNCVGEKFITLGVAARRYFDTEYKFNGTFKTLIKRFGYRSSFTHDVSGHYTLFGFQQSFKHGNDIVSIGFNRTLKIIGGTKYRVPRVVATQLDRTDLGDLN